MKSILKKILLFLTCAVFVFSAACVKKPSNGGAWTSGDPTGKDDGNSWSDVNDEEVESITVFKNDWDAFNQARKTKSPVYTKLKEAVGVDIIGQNSSGDGWQTALALRQSDGTLPDIFLTNGPSDPDFFQKLLKNNDILPISDWVDEEHYPNLYNYLKQFQYMRSNVSMFKGKMWFIPSTWYNEKSLFVRKDWIDNLNAKLDDILVKEGVVSSKAEITNEIRTEWQFKLPENILEFYRLARAFTLYDPDNNGVDDTVGYMSESNKDMDGWIYNAFGAGWNQWVKEGDSYTLSMITDGAKYATDFIAGMVQQGFMSVDSLTADNATKQDRFMSGKAGMMYAHNWLNQFVGGLMTLYKCSMEEATAKIAMINPPTGENGMGGGCGTENWWQGFCIKAKMSKSRIRKCLELYEFLLSDQGYELLQYGVKDVQWKEENGKKVALYKANDQGFVSSIVSEDTATMLYALVDWTMHYRSEVVSNGDIIVAQQKKSQANVVRSDYGSVQLDSFAEYYVGAKSYFTETISTIEKGDYWKEREYNPKTFNYETIKDISRTMNNQWNSFVKKFKENYGGATMIADYNEFINSGKAVRFSND